MTAPLEAALAASGEAALDHLITAWQGQRDPELAGLIEQSSAALEPTLGADPNDLDAWLKTAAKATARQRGELGDRRILFCKPDKFLIYDVTAGTSHWQLSGESATKFRQRRFSVTGGFVHTVYVGDKRVPTPGTTLAERGGVARVEVARGQPLR